MVTQLAFMIVSTVFFQVKVVASVLFVLPYSPGKQSSQTLWAKRSPWLMPVTLQGSVGSRCLPARAVVRAVTAKHELGLSHTCRVPTHDTALEA